jgi:SAM-dependent methyltransferase
LVSLVFAKGTARRHAQAPVSADLDRTGILVTEGKRLPLLWKDDSIVFPIYEESLAHSFWRAQEFSLFVRQRALLQRPLLDFGCGDGSFAAVLFDEIDYGVDIDKDALTTAGKFGIYKDLLHLTGNRIPLPEGSINAVISNSVLEHVQDLRNVIAEISRVLTTNGQLIFTVPVAQFTRDLAKYFGSAEADRVNVDCYHRNLLEIPEWEALLRANHLTVVSLRPYQPDWFTFYYWTFRFFGNRGFGRFFPNIRHAILKKYRTEFLDMISSSIGVGHETGGNILVVARKLPN